MKKIVTSLAMIVFVGAVVASGTGAFFSDTETSTANVFTAGAIDLKVDSQQHYNNAVCVDGKWALEAGKTATVPQYPVIGSDCGGTWALKDLLPTSDKFFNFNDVKPGDSGENTISLHIDSNDAWVCLDVTNMVDADNTQTEPETQAPLDTDDLASGELAEGLNFFAWAETDGDNVFEGSNGQESPLFANIVGPASDALNNKYYALADGGTGAPIPGGSTRYIGLAWCAGTLTPNLTTGGMTCDGSILGNEAQTDSVTADISFRVEQARNNPNFRCAPTPAPIVWTDAGTRTSGTASIIGDETAPAGANVLKLLTIDNVDSRVRYNYDIADIDLSAFTGFSYDSKQVSANDMVNGNASFRLIVDLDGNLLTLGDVKDVTYEPYYNFFVNNVMNPVSIVPGTWQTWAANMANGKFWAGGVTTVLGPSEGAGGAYATNFTMQQLLNAYPTAKILGINIGMGTWNTNQVVHVDNLIFNGVNLGF